MISRLISICVLLTVSHLAYADELIEMKCHVKSYSGQDHLIYINTTKEDRSNLKAVVAQFTVKEGKKQHVIIEKVGQCINADKVFSNVIARQKDTENGR